MSTDTHWSDDHLGRKQDAEFLYNFLIGEVEKRKSQGRTASYVLNIDAEWGGGKTFFLDRLAKDIENRGHLVARVNAWRDDHAQDPYIAIMAAIDAAFAPHIKKPGKIANAWTATKASGGAIALKVGGTVLKGLLRKHLGVSMEEVEEAIGDIGSLEDAVQSDVVVDTVKETGEQLEKLFDASLEAMIDGFKRTDEAMTDFRSKLQAAIGTIADKKKWPLFVLVDELDRCRPTYAVQLLERVKHLFDVPGVVFVFGTNSDQLKHSIAGAYGVNFDGARYLKRFFDRTYVFARASPESLVSQLCSGLPGHKIRAPDEGLAKTLSLACEAYELDLRAIEHLFEMIDASATAWPHRFPIEISLLFPLCAHFYRTGKAEWPPANDPNLKRWVLKRLHPTRDAGTVDRSIYFHNAYSAALSQSQSLRAAKDMALSGRSGADPTADYVRQTFMPEWNGVPLEDPNVPSVQTELFPLVLNAGKLVSKSKDTR